jgi:hypothetical protein
MYWRNCGPLLNILKFSILITEMKIIELVKTLNPNILTVTGRKCRPSNQGCVVRANAVIEQKMNAIDQQRLSGVKNPNWVSILPQVRYLQQ